MLKDPEFRDAVMLGAIPVILGKLLDTYKPEVFASMIDEGHPIDGKISRNVANLAARIARDAIESRRSSFGPVT